MKKKTNEYLVSDIFTLISGKGITKDEIAEHPGTLPAVQSGAENNAVIGMIDRDYCIEKKYSVVNSSCLTVARSGTAGFVSFHKDGCVVGDSAKALICKSNIDDFTYLYMRTILMANKYKYAYGRKVTIDKYLTQKITLPSNSSGEPDYKYMSSYIKKLNYKPITTNIKSKEVNIALGNCKLFRMDELFTIKKGKRLTKADMIVGNLNYLGAISDNNGVRQMIQAEGKHVFQGNCITINYNGSVGEAFYQKDRFWASDDVNVLFSKGWELNKYVALYICTVIKANKYRFNYGRKWTKEKMEETKISLPSKDGKPDFEFMEKFIKNLSYADRI